MDAEFDVHLQFFFRDDLAQFRDLFCTYVVYCAGVVSCDGADVVDVRLDVCPLEENLEVGVERIEHRLRTPCGEETPNDDETSNSARSGALGMVGIGAVASYCGGEFGDEQHRNCGDGRAVVDGRRRCC